MINNFLNNIDGITSIFLKGSKQRPETVDYWSDTDLLIVKEHFEETDKRSLEACFGQIIGKQLYEYDGGLTYRVVSSKNDEIIGFDIQLVGETFFKKYEDEFSDMTCLYGHKNFNNKSQDYKKPSFDKSQVEDVWFRIVECIKKLSRKDHLIGMHELLNILREFLVLEMLERDEKKKTTIHRYGDSEVLPASLNLKHLEDESATTKLTYLKTLSKAYDDKLRLMYPEYVSRYKLIEKHIETSIKLLSKTEINEAKEAID